MTNVDNVNGAEALLKALEAEKAKVIFGYPGGVLVSFYESLCDSNIIHILTRHEQAAAHMADGYARASGKAGFCIGTSGPGATNLVTGVATAHMDSSPVIAITGQVSSDIIGDDAFQEIDSFGIFMPITKHNFQIRKSDDLVDIMAKAHEIATTGRPGPVHVDIPSDILVGELSNGLKIPADINISSYKPTTVGHPLQIKKTIEAIVNSKKPLILAGGGVSIAQASNELLEFAELLNVPVCTTLMGKGCISEKHELSTGLTGMHGTYASNNLIEQCDLLISIGCRFSDRVTGKASEFAPNAKIIHMDIDPAEIGKNVPVDIPIVGDAKRILQDLIKQLKKHNISLDTTEWMDEVNKLMKLSEEELKITEEESKSNNLENTKNNEKLHPKVAIYDLMDAIYDIDPELENTYITTDVGQNQMWMARYFKFKKDALITSGGLGTMGFGFPAALGVKFAKPNANVISISGDGGFLMNSQELATMAHYDIPIVAVIFNNRALGMVHQLQSVLKNRQSQIHLGETPDFIELAHSYGVRAERVSNSKDLKETLKKAISLNKPYVIEVMIDPSHAVKVVAPGAKITQMIEPENKEPCSEQVLFKDMISKL
ncbi:biosynthetic-type acetolactate synthase large subunit [Methanococcus voltae]|uniref:Acetolactate synthase n=1 Tax=Methanococcus voltae (strain ATCC BAA-1334 / A3) TaxID=456320 RepID=D7DS23_METV3|nr:biosynthetic-type acetolactate synthase large subunit [Methanococcus voltae]MCS3901458.1 acetolactate synthase-1/2/3 large subunit [Methanococcus voltae]